MQQQTWETLFHAASLTYLVMKSIALFGIFYAAFGWGHYYWAAMIWPT